MLAQTLTSSVPPILTNDVNVCYKQCVTKLTDEQIARIRQLRRAGYPMATIGKLFGVDRSVVAYHTKNLPQMRLDDFLKAMLPHMPLDGPPLPKGWSPTWNELTEMLNGSNPTEHEGGEDI